MELKDFVSKTLIDIITGVKDAQVLAKEYGASINPANTGILSASKAIMAKDNDNITFLQRVDFSLSLLLFNWCFVDIIKVGFTVVYPCMYIA